MALLAMKDVSFCYPEGTACIEIDIHSRKTKRVIFSKGISTVDGMTFDLNNRDKIIKWIEKETGLIYGRQFEFWREEERELHFKECIDGIAVSPSGNIEVKLDNEGRLILFSIYGQFPSEKLVKLDKYSLSLEQIEKIANEQLKLVEFPQIEQKKLIPAFAIEEIYIKNNDLSTLPYEVFVKNDNFSLQLDKVIEWEDNNVQEAFRHLRNSLWIQES